MSVEQFLVLNKPRVGCIPQQWQSCEAFLAAFFATQSYQIRLGSVFDCHSDEGPKQWFLFQGDAFEKNVLPDVWFVRWTDSTVRDIGLVLREVKLLAPLILINLPTWLKVAPVVSKSYCNLWFDGRAYQVSQPEKWKLQINFGLSWFEDAMEFSNDISLFLFDFVHPFLQIFGIMLEEEVC